MDLRRLANFPPWQWPPDIGNTLLAVLRDRNADESEHLLAAEIVAINDDSPASCCRSSATPPHPTSCTARAALALGPVLEQTDMDSIGDLPGLDDDSFDAPPISEHTFHRIQETLRTRYLDYDIPTEVRRRILESRSERRTPAMTGIGGSRQCSRCGG